jgi:hypothetical protein
MSSADRRCILGSRIRRLVNGKYGSFLRWRHTTRAPSNVRLGTDSRIVCEAPKGGGVRYSVSLGVTSAFGKDESGEICDAADVDGDRKGDILLFKPQAKGGGKGNVLTSPSGGNKFDNDYFQRVFGSPTHNCYCIAGLDLH